jgi:secreted trypsin-like serine protease
MKYIQQGDSGGPLMVQNSSGKYVLAGIVSFGQFCDDPSYTPGINLTKRCFENCVTNTQNDHKFFSTTYNLCSKKSAIKR